MDQPDSTPGVLTAEPGPPAPTDERDKAGDIKSLANLLSFVYA